MPPSHIVSRAVLALLLAGATAGLVVAGADPEWWQRANALAQEYWALLRAGISVA